MSKFCTKCGASIEDNSSFCTSCGAKFDAAPAASTASADSNDSILDKFKANANVETIKGLQSNPNFKKYVGIGVVAIAAIIIICILVSVLSGGYMKPIENYFEGIVKKDAETFMEAYHEYQRGCGHTSAWKSRKLYRIQPGYSGRNHYSRAGAGYFTTRRWLHWRQN